MGERGLKNVRGVIVIPQKSVSLKGQRGDMETFYLRLARRRSRNRRFSSFFFLRKLKKKANAPLLTPESWHRGVTDNEKANGEVRFSLQGQMETKKASKN